MGNIENRFATKIYVEEIFCMRFTQNKEKTKNI